MMVCQDRKAQGATGQSQFDPAAGAGGALPAGRSPNIAEILEEKGNFESVEVIVVRGTEAGSGPRSAARSPARG